MTKLSDYNKLIKDIYSKKGVKFWKVLHKKKILKIIDSYLTI